MLTEVWQMPTSLWLKNHFYTQETPVKRVDYCLIHRDIYEFYGAGINFVLHDIYTKFNIYHPEGYLGRSLSAGDVVGLDGQYWLCCDEGWKQIEF